MSEHIAESTTLPLSKSEQALTWKRSGPRHTENVVTEVFPGVLCVKLTQGRHALIDCVDWDRLRHIRWVAHRMRAGIYAVGNIWANGKGSTVHMSRAIMAAPDNMVVDHINGNTLINRRFNLRVVTGRVNARNRHDQRTSSYPGVSYCSGVWISMVSFLGKNVYLGRFKDELVAASIYQNAITEIEAGTFAPPVRYHSVHPNVNWYKDGRKWHAREPITGHHIGYFTDIQDAISAVAQARQRQAIASNHQE